MMIKKFIPVLVAAILIGSLFNHAYAEDIKKKFTISFGIHNYTTVDEIRSEADYRAYYMDGEEVLFFRADPRPDSAATNVLKIRDAFEATLGMSYGFTSWFLIQTDIGYVRGDVGALEATVLFSGGVDPEADKLFEERGEYLFRLYLIPCGTLAKIPVQTSAIVRFRPKSNFNPYLGTGIGYIFVQYKSSSELNQFSDNIDRSVGAFLKAGESENIFSDLGGVTVEVPNSLEYHFIGGFDFTFKKHWSVFMDARYTFASRKMKIMIDGVEKFGIGFPNGRVEHWSVVPPAEGQPYQITSGGAFDFNGDGVLDKGLYYVNGGSLKYGGFSIGAGIKYTF